MEDTDSYHLAVGYITHKATFTNSLVKVITHKCKILCVN